MSREYRITEVGEKGKKARIDIGGTKETAPKKYNQREDCCKVGVRRKGNEANEQKCVSSGYESLGTQPKCKIVSFRDTPP